jgi:hypothetical protein
LVKLWLRKCLCIVDWWRRKWKVCYFLGSWRKCHDSVYFRLNSVACFVVDMLWLRWPFNASLLLPYLSFLHVIIILMVTVIRWRISCFFLSKQRHCRSVENVIHWTKNLRVLCNLPCKFRKCLQKDRGCFLPFISDSLFIQTRNINEK